MKVLIAEDDAISRKILKKTVENFGHDCLVASDGAEAWDLFQNTPDIDVVVSDWMMPNMDGLELCRRVRSLDRPGYTYFVFLTALTGQEHLLEGMRAGADEYLTKPLDREQLRGRLVAASRINSVHQHLHDERETITPGEHNGGGAGAGGSTSTPLRRSPRLGKQKVWDILVAQN